MWNVLTRDLSEFVSTVRSDTTEAASSVASVLAPPPNEEGGKHLPKNAQLKALQSDPKTFTEDPPEAEREEFELFAKDFDVGTKTSEISDLLNAEPALTTLHANLVPDEVAYDRFWLRYFYRVGKMQKSKVAFTDLEDEDDEELAWGEDEQEPPQTQSINEDPTKPMDKATSMQIQSLEQQVDELNVKLLAQAEEIAALKTARDGAEKAKEATVDELRTKCEALESDKDALEAKLAEARTIQLGSASNSESEVIRLQAELERVAREKESQLQAERAKFADGAQAMKKKLMDEHAAQIELIEADLQRKADETTQQLKAELEEERQKFSRLAEKLNSLKESKHQNNQTSGPLGLEVAPDEEDPDWEDWT